MTHPNGSVVPKKSPGPSIATTASRPMRESTESVTAPFWMYLMSAEPALSKTAQRTSMIRSYGSYKKGRLP